VVHCKENLLSKKRPRTKINYCGFLSEGFFQLLIRSWFELFNDVTVEAKLAGKEILAGGG